MRTNGRRKGYPATRGDRAVIVAENDTTAAGRRWKSLPTPMILADLVLFLDVLMFASLIS